VNKNYQCKKELIHDQKHLAEALAHKKKTRKLVILNGILYFFSHIPEFTATLLIIIYKEQIQDFCFDYFSSTEIAEVFNSFGVIGISLQFFVYKHFDQNYINSYNDLKKRKLHLICFKWFVINRNK